MLYPRAGCDGNWEHVLCWVPVAISSSCSLPEEQPASSLAGTPVNRRYPLLMLRRIRGEESCVNPHPNPCVMFLSMLTPPLPLFLLPPPISPLPQLLEKKKAKQQQTSLVVFVVSGGGCCCCCCCLRSVCFGMRCLHASRTVDDASRPVHCPDVC